MPNLKHGRDSSCSRPQTPRSYLRRSSKERCAPPPKPDQEVLLLTDLFTGKQWHAQKSAFRPKAGNTSYQKRNAQRIAMDAMKAKEREMKEEKANEKAVRQKENSGSLVSNS